MLVLRIAVVDCDGTDCTDFSLAVVLDDPVVIHRRLVLAVDVLFKVTEGGSEPTGVDVANALSGVLLQGRLCFFARLWPCSLSVCVCCLYRPS